MPAASVGVIWLADALRPIAGSGERAACRPYPLLVLPGAAAAEACTLLLAEGSFDAEAPGTPADAHQHACSSLSSGHCVACGLVSLFSAEDGGDGGDGGDLACTLHPCSRDRRAAARRVASALQRRGPSSTAHLHAALMAHLPSTSRHMLHALMAAGAPPPAAGPSPPAGMPMPGAAISPPSPAPQHAGAIPPLQGAEEPVSSSRAQQIQEAPLIGQAQHASMPSHAPQPHAAMHPRPPAITPHGPQARQAAGITGSTSSASTQPSSWQQLLRDGLFGFQAPEDEEAFERFWRRQQLRVDRAGLVVLCLFAAFLAALELSRGSHGHARAGLAAVALLGAPQICANALLWLLRALSARHRDGVVLCARYVSGFTYVVLGAARPGFPASVSGWWPTLPPHTARIFQPLALRLLTYGVVNPSVRPVRQS